MKVKIIFANKRDRDMLVKDCGELHIGTNLCTPFDDTISLTSSYSVTVKSVESVTISNGGTFLVVKTERARTQHRAWGAVRVEAEVTR